MKIKLNTAILIKKTLKIARVVVIVAKESGKMKNKYKILLLIGLIGLGVFLTYGLMLLLSVNKPMFWLIIGCLCVFIFEREILRVLKSILKMKVKL